jgi:predicted anti-sigma-YlaC factor YlaD
MNCTGFHEQLDAYLEETLDEDRRAEFRNHLQECASCGEWARTVEPSLLFTMAESGPVDLVRIEACAAAVTGQIRQRRLAERLQRRRLPWFAAAAAAALVLAGAAFWRQIPGGPDIAPEVSLAADRGAAEDPPPTVEVEMPGDDVRVYQFATDEDPDTAVYFIVNPALEL